MPSAKNKLTGNMLIAQSGGPTMVINQSLIGAIKEAGRHAAIRRIYGSQHGIRGILEEDFIENIDRVDIIHLPTPILRAPHALAASVGYLLGLFQK